MYVGGRCGVEDTWSVTDSAIVYVQALEGLFRWVASLDRIRICEVPFSWRRWKTLPNWLKQKRESYKSAVRE